MEEKTPDGVEVKPYEEAFNDRAPLDLAQRSTVVGVLDEQRRNSASNLEESRDCHPARQPIMVTTGHTFPAFSSQPTYLVGWLLPTSADPSISQMTGYYRGVDGDDYVESEQEVETEKIYKL